MKSDARFENSGDSGSTAPRVPGTQAIDRALDVLSCIANAREIGITEVARSAGLSPSTTHRIIQALVARGFVEQSPSTDRYRLGQSAAILGQAAHEELGLDLALPILERLGAETGESVNMGLREGNRVKVVLRVRSTQALRFDQPVGSSRPLHSSSMGKALLAFADGPDGSFEIDTLDLAPVTDNTIVDPEQLHSDLAAIRDRGYSTDAEESIIGVSCVGAPILNAAGQAVAAMAVQGPSVRMNAVDKAQLGERLMAAAAEIGGVLRLEFSRRSAV